MSAPGDDVNESGVADDDLTLERIEQMMRDEIARAAGDHAAFAERMLEARRAHAKGQLDAMIAARAAYFRKLAGIERGGSGNEPGGPADPDPEPKLPTGPAGLDELEREIRRILESG